MILPRMLRAAAAAMALLTATAETLVPLNSEWLYRPGTQEASSPPSAWRAVAFDTRDWASGNAPFYYGENLAGGTVLSGMRYEYTSVFLRKTFLVPDPSEIDRLALRVQCDDGFLVWINGQEQARFNMPAGEHAFDSRAQGAIEPTWVTNSLSSPSNFLRQGMNVITVHLFNANLTSSDLVFNLQLDSTTDRIAPTIVEIAPPSGEVEELREVTITFSEAVQGIAASDLLINNTPASSVTGTGASYTFAFDQPPFGAIDFTWDEGHLIQDFADPPHDFDHTAEAATWSYLLQDTTAPQLVSIHPLPGSAVRALSQVEIAFSEEVQGLDASDLLLNGVPAHSVQALPDNSYTFQFDPAPAGPAQISWAPAHDIRDLAIPPNPFSAEGWGYEIDPSLPVAQVVISEFITAQENLNGLRDEDGELQDWIELHNLGTSPVNLAGWSLTDDADEPGLWTFPEVTIPAGGHLVVFASGKNRKTSPEGLHTSFKLSSSGEYLALFNAESPRQALSEFAEDYPEQRNDYSYGLDPSGLWRYFSSPTPGEANPASTIVAIAPPPTLNFNRGLYEEPFTLVMFNPLPGGTIRYTLNGDPPTAATGLVYEEPLEITATTILRAAIFADDHLSSTIITHTFILLDDVLTQPNNPPGFPSGPTVMSGYPSDYEMDPEIVQDPAYTTEMKAALQALPVLSIVMKRENMFGADNGIYTHPLSRGPAWERPCSIEFMPLDGNDFQLDGGIQIQRNGPREPIKNPKHPMRIVFKGNYGPKNLEYQMFPDSPVDVFDTLILRADFNYSWRHWNPTQRIRAQRTRDAWMKDSMRAMGGLASHNRYVHLYINGLYWGIYDPSERPDGSFGAAYLGGVKEDYDVINEGAVVDGSATAYNAMLSISNLGSPDQYQAMQQYLDMTQFIDYMLLHFYVAHSDWGNNKNWYTLRPRDGSSGFKYVPWDGEMILEDPSRNRVTSSDTPSGLHTKLLASDEYRLAFGDRARKHLLDGGALTPDRVMERCLKRAREVELPIIAESARWGDYRRDVHQYQSPPYQLYTRDNQWRAEQERLLTSYFPTRSSVVLGQLRSAGLYPAVAAASFNHYGGHVQPGFELSMSAPAGAIYYTTDGTDPRTPFTSGLSPSAEPWSGPIVIGKDTVVKARVLMGSAWSALTEAVFTTQSIGVPLRITEIMYHPNPPGEEFEFLEIQNTGNLPLPVGSYYITGVDYVFPPHTTLAPGQIILLASLKNPAAFAERYPDVPVFGTFGGQLVNRGERIALVTPEGRTIISVDYSDAEGWPEEADGGGYSLEVIDPLGDPDDPANWERSAAFGGSPGQPNAAPPTPAVMIHELQAAGPGGDWLELHNTSGQPVDLSGWAFTDFGASGNFIFPAGTSIPSLGFILVHCDGQTNALGLHAPFALSGEAETVALLDLSGNRISIVTAGPQVAGFTLSWVAGQWTLGTPTPNAPNQSAPTASPSNLVINEVMPDPLPGEDDWLEIYNAHSSLPVSLRGLFITTADQLFEITSAGWVAPEGHVRLIADENPGADHLDLKLSAGGPAVSLLLPAGQIIDELAFTNPPEGTSLGRYPDGAENLAIFDFPSPGAPNSLGFELAVAAAVDAVELSWPSIPGQVFRVEAATTLSPPGWETVGEFTATNHTSSFGELPGQTNRYYRVLALPR